MKSCWKYRHGFSESYQNKLNEAILISNEIEEQSYNFYFEHDNSRNMNTVSNNTSSLDIAWSYLNLSIDVNTSIHNWITEKASSWAFPSF